MIDYRIDYRKEHDAFGFPHHVVFYADADTVQAAYRSLQEMFPDTQAARRYRLNRVLGDRLSVNFRSKADLVHFKLRWG